MGYHEKLEIAFVLLVFAIGFIGVFSLSAINDLREENESMKAYMLHINENYKQVSEYRLKEPEYAPDQYFYLVASVCLLVAMFGLLVAAHVEYKQASKREKTQDLATLNDAANNEKPREPSA